MILMKAVQKLGTSNRSINTNRTKVKTNDCGNFFVKKGS